MKNKWFIDKKLLPDCPEQLQQECFEEIHTYVENKQKRPDILALSEGIQYLIINDIFEGEKIQILMKYEEESMENVKVVAFLKIKKRIRDKSFSKRFIRHIKEILGIEY